MDPTSSGTEFWGHKHALEEMVDITEGCSDFRFGFVDNGPTECGFEVSWLDAAIEGGAVKLTNINPYRLIDESWRLFTDHHPGSYGEFSRRSARYFTMECKKMRRRNSWRSQVTFGVGA